MDGWMDGLMEIDLRYAVVQVYNICQVRIIEPPPLSYPVHITALLAISLPMLTCVLLVCLHLPPN